jgi:hypothetical protein
MKVAERYCAVTVSNSKQGRVIWEQKNNMESRTGRLSYLLNQREG